MRRVQEFYVFLVATMLFLCGCGSNSSPAPQPLQPPSALSYTSPTSSYTKSVAITPNTPTVTGGAVSSYSVSPALPAGLSLNVSSGIISGSPSEKSTAKIYTVSASNSAGNASATLSIEIKDVAPASLAYTPATAVYNVGYPISITKPAITGGEADSFTVVPTLPWGLNFNPSTGAISGTPTVVTRKTNYTVTAFNSGGSAKTALALTIANVAPAVLTYSDNPASYVADVPIHGNLPSNAGGAPSSYSVNPPLPTGLSINAGNGVINGIPLAPAATAPYTVTASNSLGSTSATLVLTIKDRSASTLVYTPNTLIATVDVPITPLVPTNSGGAAKYSVQPSLPMGFTLDTNNGAISGMSVSQTTTQNFTVTASGASGESVAEISLTVNPAGPWAQSLPNMNQIITPLAPDGAQFQQLNPGLPDNPTWLATHAATSIVSPDGTTLLVLTSGYNRVYDVGSDSLQTYNQADSMEYVFVYDISTGTPIRRQALPVPITYHGIAWDPASTPTSKRFYVAGCTTDNIHTFSYSTTRSVWEEELNSSNKPVLAMAHGTGNGLSVLPQGSVPVNAQVFVYPCAAGLAVSDDGNKLVVANYYNDSISVFTGGYGNWQPTTASAVPNIDLRPGHNPSAPAHGTPGGEDPFWVTVSGDGTATPYVAYVSSIRDREIDVVNLSLSTPQVTVRIPVKGQPNKMTMNKARTLLYVAEDQTDTIDVIDIDASSSTVYTILESIPVIAPAGLLPPSFYYADSTTSNANPVYTGANTNSVTLSPDETKLFVTNGNLNNVAVVQLTGANADDQVIGLIPTGWYPNSVSVNPAGTMMYVVNAKSPTGANPNWCYGYGPTTFQPNCFPSNEYNPQRTKAGLQSFPIPDTTQLATLTTLVASNNHFSHTESASDAAVMASVSQGVKHVIFIIKENRTYDQVLGDLVDSKGSPLGNGDPRFVQWGQAMTPNLHSLARNFVTLDNFMATSEISYDGWLWSTAARSPDIVEHQFPVVYSFRGLSLDSEGLNRSVNVALATNTERMAANPVNPNDPDLLPGQTNSNAPDGPNNEINTGYLWDAVLRAGMTVRNYGFFVDTTCYNEPACQTPLIHDPAATHTVVAVPSNVALAPYTDPYFRGFDNQFPDYYRFKEWEREFDANYAKGGLPNLTLVRLMHDHTGNFATAIDMVNTPEVMQADNDYAVGLLVQKIANSIYAQNTLIFVVEDDAQDGADHVDSHRTVAFVAGAYVKQNAVVSTPYNTIDFIRTIEEVLGLKQYLNLNDALARPMVDVFNTTPMPWTFTASPSPYLYTTQLPLPAKPLGLVIPKSTHGAEYWARATRGLNFADADMVDTAVFNQILWKGMMGKRPYPTTVSGSKDVGKKPIAKRDLD